MLLIEEYGKIKNKDGSFAHLVAEDGSVGGNPKPLTWKTESSYQPVG